MDRLHADDCIIFPIVVGNRHSIARYPLIPIDDTYKVDHELFEFYYVSGANVELGIFQYIMDRIDAGVATHPHPDIDSAVKLTPIKPQKLARSTIIATCHLSYRARAGELIAYYSAPFRVIVEGNVLSSPAHSNALCGDGFAARFEFIANFIVNCYS